MIKNRLLPRLVVKAILAASVLLVASHASAFITSGSGSQSDPNNANKFIFYSDVGHGTPLVLIHAFPTDHSLFTPQENGLKNRFRVISLDLWGFGKSAGTQGQAVTMQDYAAEVKQLLDQLHIQKALIGGESMGGYVALAFLHAYPKRVKGLILSDTQAITDSDATKLKREESATLALTKGTNTLIHDFLPKALSKDANEATRDYLKTMMQTQKPTAFASALRGMALREDTSDVLANTNVPVLILTGDKDKVINVMQSINMESLAKKSKLVVILNAGHLSSLEQPEQWNQAVLKMFGHA